MSPLLVAVAPEKLLTMAIIIAIAAAFVIGTGLVMAVTGRVLLGTPTVPPAQPHRVRRVGAGLTLLGIGALLLAAGIYTSLANLASLPFFGAGLIVLRPRRAEGALSKRFALAVLVITLLLFIGVWWALPLYLRS